MERDTIYATSLLFILVLTAIIAYHFLENWDWLDSTYFAVATMTTVGYGDLIPKTDAGKAFTIFFIIVSVSTGFYTIISLGRSRETMLRDGFERFADRFPPIVRGNNTDSGGKLVQEKLIRHLDLDLDNIQPSFRKTKKKNGRFIEEDFQR